MTGVPISIIINRLSGCGEAWYRAWFGSKRPRVRIPTLRPKQKGLLWQPFLFWSDEGFEPFHASVLWTLARCGLDRSDSFISRIPTLQPIQQLVERSFPTQSAALGGRAVNSGRTSFFSLEYIFYKYFADCTFRHSLLFSGDFCSCIGLFKSLLSP